MTNPRQKVTTDIGIQRGEWMDTHLAGLLAAGVSKDDITIIETLSRGETTIAVRGKTFAQCTLVFTATGITFITTEPTTDFKLR